MKKIFAILLLINLFINNANSIEADVFVQSTVNRASEILSKNISKEEKMSGLKIIAKETVDIRGIGFYSLGSARKVLNKTFISPLFEFITDANSSFCVLAKLNPSIIKSLIKGLSEFFV